MSAREEWNALASVTALGTQRAGAALPVRSDGVGELCARLECTTQEERLLVALTAASIWERTGALPARARIVDPSPASQDDLPEAGRAAADLLAAALRDPRPRIAHEWCRLAMRRGVRVPSELLPFVLDALDAGDPQDPFRAVLGARGAWLLGLERPSTAGADPAAEFAARAGAERRAALRAWRAIDPAAARAALDATLAESGADERADLVAALDVSLSPDDEPFLEARLDDRAKSVRAAAAELLARLPSSALTKRMRTRLLALVEVQPARLLRSRSLQIALPDENDPELARDGVEARARGKLGAKAVGLAEIVGRAPLDAWSNELGIAPADAVRALAKNEWRSAVLGGLCAAAVRRNDADWARALLETGVAFEPEIGARDVVASLARLVPERSRDTLLEGLRAGGRVTRIDTWCALAGDAWSLATSRAFVAWLAGARPKKPDDVEPLHDGAALRIAAVHVDRRIAQESERLLEPLAREATGIVKTNVEQWLATLALRARIGRELSNGEDED